MSKKKNKKKEPKQTTKKQKIKQVIDTHQGWALKGFLVSSILLILTGVLYQYWLHKQYQKTLTYLLPTETTAFALEVNHNPSLDQVQKLQNHPNQEQINQFLNPETTLLNQTKLTSTLQQAPQKIFTYQVFQNKLFPTFIYRLQEPFTQNQFPAQIISQNSDKSWQYFSKEDILIISESQDLNTYIFNSQKDYRNSITQNPRFQDSYNQIPLHNLANFYINHQVLPQLSNDTFFPKNNISKITNFTNQLGFTNGYIKVRSEDLLMGSYTNLQNESRTYFSPRNNLLKYQAEISSFIPENTSISFYGTQLSPILKTLVQNNLSTQNFQQSLKEILVSYNLDSEQDFETLNQIFDQEYAIHNLADQNSIQVTIPKQSLQSQQAILDLLSRLEAHFNPEVISYQLEDGTTARNLISSEPTFQSIESEDANKQFSFDLKEIDTQLSFDASSAEFDTIVISNPDIYKLPAPLLQVSNKPILSQGSSHSTISSEFLQTYLQESFQVQKENLPSSRNSFYFFDDGLQTVSSLVW